MAIDFDEELRVAAFAYLDRLRTVTGGPVVRSQLEAFEFRGTRVPLIGMRGILKPGRLDVALSLLTTYARTPSHRPYEDDIGPDTYPRYKWRGLDPDAWDNHAVRLAMELDKPLIWFVGIAPGVFDPIYPVWIVDEEPEAHQFVLALDEVTRHQWQRGLSFIPAHDPVRRYAEAMVRSRLHQPFFRQQVLRAYESQCALCRLRHVRLLDAAHIKEDADGGEPIVPNGLAMCAIHHRAFDAQVLGVRPDYRVEIRADVLTETDGPTLQHALQGVHGQLIVLPRRRIHQPNKDLLEERFERFRAAG